MLLSQDLATFLTASNEVRHDLFSRSERQILEDLEALGLNRRGDLVREASELAKSDSLRLLEPSLISEFHGDVTSVLVVRCDKDHVFVLHLRQQVLQVGVVTHVGVLNGIPHWGLSTFIGCEISFFIHVGSSDQFDAEVEAKHLGSLNFHGDGVGHSLEVALIAIHDDDFLVLVELVGHLLSKRLDCCLDESLLGINIQLAISLIGSLSELSNSLVVEIKVCEICVRNVSRLSRNLLH